MECTAQERVELLLSGPVSWTRLVVGRWVAVVAGILVVSTVAPVALLVTAVGGTILACVVSERAPKVA